jgi:S-adenosylmethionine/arginine decarboxylase-like enzyme
MADELLRRCTQGTPLHDQQASDGVPHPPGLEDAEPAEEIGHALVSTTALVVPMRKAWSPATIWHGFMEMINDLGLTVFATTWHDFAGVGMSGVVVLGESHAAIHTWPEKQQAWVELATCGDPKVLTGFRMEAFDLDARIERAVKRGA